MGALSHLRIVEIGSAAATSYCARLFADFGAIVQKVEPPQGDPLRRTAPLTPKGQSAWFGFLNFNKSSIALDPDNAGAAQHLIDLIAGCDILIDGRDIENADCLAFDLAALKARNPGLIHLTASWFGEVGPYAKFGATDSTIRALTGLIKLVGPVDGPPMHAPDFQTGILAGLWGFVAAASSVIGRMRDGRGRSSALSIFESSIAVTEYIMFESFSRGDIMVLADVSGRHL
jgi:crotonobetainyl-CoA:carnitine CoA-transferase CaiB-like acyl-CoA transferase